MKIVQCKKCGKFYDAAKFKNCPICAEGKAGEEARERRTAALFYGGGIARPDMAVPQSSGEQGRLTERYFDTHKPQPDGCTIGLYRTRNVNPVAGWLVCCAGGCRGRFYTIYSGKNEVGTSRSMDVVLSGENVCAENHACIIFDDRNIDFYIKPQNGSVSVNGAPVIGQCALQPNDRIKLGGMTFDFIPYCTKSRNWNTPENQPQDEKEGRTDEKD